MLIFFNIIIIALVLLIAYWWANQGLFSAILHLVCVIVAGAVALAVWEPLTTGLLLRGNMFDDYAWGVSLIVVFALMLAILRVSMDKLVPGNVDMPRWANLTFGFPVGALAGIITIGIFMIGAGFIQSTKAIMDFQGYARASRGAKIEEVNTLWAPVHQWTSKFYSLLSVGALYPTFNNTPLRQLNPDLHFQSASLVRDSALNGRGKLSLRPADAHVGPVLYDPSSGKYLVSVRFEAGARDFGEQLTLSSAQVRLIGSASGSSEPKVIHPDQWTQYDGPHRFDDLSHYVTSQPGQSQANVVFEFPARELNNIAPKFIQIRNTRYELKPPTTVASSKEARSVASSERISIDASAQNIQDAIQQAFDIRPVNASTNMKPSEIEVTPERFISGGMGDFVTSGGERASRKLTIMGIHQPQGTRIVKVDVSRESPANLFGSVREKASEDAKIMLVDSQGRPYYPIGYIHQRPDNKTRIKVDFQRYLPTMKDIPLLPTAGGQPLKLLFSVTEGATIVGLKLGEVTVGTCSLLVKDPKAANTSDPEEGAPAE